MPSHFLSFGGTETHAQIFLSGLSERPQVKARIFSSSAHAMCPRPRNMLLGVVEGTLRAPAQVTGGDRVIRLDFLLCYNFFLIYDSCPFQF